MSNELTVKVDEAVAKSKEAAWAKFGRGIYTTELKLQAIAQDAILKIKLPTTIEEVKAAEEQLKELKKVKVGLEVGRKEITSRFDAKSSELMQPEKSLDPKILELNNAIISVKKAEQVRQQAEQNKTDEMKRVRENLQKQLADIDAACKTKILNQITKAYEYALNNNVKPADVQKHINACAGKFTAFDFTANPFEYKPVYITEAEYKAIEKELWVINADDHLANYQSELKAKFEFYEIEFNNKEAALQKSKEAETAAINKITDDKENKTIAATLESTATVLVGTSDVKALKKAYKIDMIETEENAMILLKAYFANMALCKDKLQVKKWFNFSVSNIVSALEKVKNNDNSFAPTGVIFTEIDKL